jgi:hypothetical protein
VPEGEDDDDTGEGSVWSIGVDGSDLRRLLDVICWADLRPQRRKQEEA